MKSDPLRSFFSQEVAEDALHGGEIVDDMELGAEPFAAGAEDGEFFRPGVGHAGQDLGVAGAIGRRDGVLAMSIGGGGLGGLADRGEHAFTVAGDVSRSDHECLRFHQCMNDSGGLSGSVRRRRQAFNGSIAEPCSGLVQRSSVKANRAPTR